MNNYEIAAIVILFGAVFIKFLHIVYEVVEDIWSCRRRLTLEEKKASYIKDVRNSCWLALQNGISHEEILDIIDQEVIRNVHES